VTGRSATPDDALVRRAQHGDRTAVVALYDRYVHEIYGFALNQLGRRQDAEDLTSEVFLRLVRSLDTFRGQSSFRTWLYAIARNQVRDHWRYHVRRPTEPLRADVAHDAAREDRRPDIPGAAPERQARPEATALGRHVLAELPENYRRVLEHRVLEGRSVRDTAEAMGTTPGNVKVMQHRALRKAETIAMEWDGRDDDDAHHTP
jgi:RNA polymerase sigma-70 factor (ECF subfamily)